MKSFLKHSLILVAFFGLALNSSAQKAGKFGHINSNDLLMVMPDRDTAETKLAAFGQQLELQLASMTQEYEKKYTNYQTEAAKGTMNEVVRASLEEEIIQLQQRIQEFQSKAQQSLQQKEVELMEPLIKKAKDAITAVAKEHGYTYIFDTGTGSVLYYPEGDDILPLVKKQMGITAAAAAPASAPK
ncbi:OmpH family outer membrane protein [bacterium SCSIO 12741]|nr:OmpH family outer membrane protein [bacterium SCSIO 12741]